MQIEEFLEYLNSGNRVEAGSAIHKMMYELSNRAMQITCELNSSYHTPHQVRSLISHLNGKKVDDSLIIFAPLYTDCGLNMTFGKNVFINSGCHFQDQGGITIGDGTNIGHGVTIATLNHGIEPEDRHSLYPAAVIIGRNVWVGAGATILPGVTIGDNAIVGAGSVVTKEVPSNTIVAGVPARAIRRLDS